MISTLEKLLAPLRTRVANMVSRAVVRLIDDSTKMQLLQLELLPGEVREGVERVQNYGFTSVPLDGAEAAVVFVGGKRDHGLVVAVDDRRYRLTGLQGGEVAMYSDQGDQITIKRNGNIEIKGASKVVVNSPLVELAQPAVDAAIKGTTYRAAETILNTALATALSTAGASLSGAGASLSAAGADPLFLAAAPVAAAAVAAAGVAVTAGGAALTTGGTAPTTFEGGAATYLSTKVKVG